MIRSKLPVTFYTLAEGGSSFGRCFISKAILWLQKERTPILHIVVSATSFNPHISNVSQIPDLQISGQLIKKADQQLFHRLVREYLCFVIATSVVSAQLSLHLNHLCNNSSKIHMKQQSNSRRVTN